MNYNLIFIIVFTISICIFIITFLTIANPRFRSKIMKREIKSLRYMLDESKDDLENLGESAIQIRKNILDKNEGSLKDISSKEADISKEKIKVAAKAIKEGLENDKIYCKYCGKLIDSDSKFCNYCGKSL